MSAAPPRRRPHAALGVMTASGFAGLGYQIVWTQQGAVWLGHETAAVLAVVTAFFGGLALGALSLGRRIERSQRPDRWYAALEITIAAWTVLLALLMAPAGAWMLELIGAEPGPVAHWAMAFLATFIVLLPATAAMGATLPAMERVIARAGWPGGSIAALYASNTLGAVVGVLAVALWLVPALGLARTAAICAALNVACAVAAMRLGAGALPVAPASITTTSPRMPWLLAATGFLGIGYEVLAVRVISQVTENTVYTFAVVLAVYLVGTAVGAAVYQRWLAAAGAAPQDGDPITDRLLLLLATSCLLGTASLFAAPAVAVATMQALGPGMASAIAAEGALGLAAFALPTLVMGALFSHLATQARAAGIAFSRSLGINTLGAAAAPMAFGVVALPWLGAKLVLLLIAAAYAAIASRRVWRMPASWATTAAAIGLALWAPALTFIDVPPGGQVVSYREDATATVSVVEDAHGVRRLRINNRQQEGSNASLLVDSRQALLPLLLHAEPRRALFLGLGTGTTAAAAAADPTLQVDAVELLPGVIEAAAHFDRAAAWQDDRAAAAPQAGGATSHEADRAAPRDVPGRLRVVAADARRFVKTGRTRYDVIVSDNFHPARSGSGALYTVEHFQAVRGRLAPDGIFCQWLPLHQLDLETLRTIVATFMAVYPEGTAMLASNSLDTPVLGLVARAGAARLNVDALRRRLASTTLPQALAEYGLGDELALLGTFVAGPAALTRFAGSAELNTDDRPVVAHRAPRITYVPDSTPRARLRQLLGSLHLEPAELIDATAGPAWRRRLAAYWQARDHFIAAGMGVRPTADARAMLAQVREPLLAVLRISPDFAPAYEPLLGMAAALAQVDPGEARSLLAELARTQPRRPEATELLRGLSAPRP